MPESLKKFVRMESAGGLLLMAATVVALLVANSPLSAYYDVLLDTPVEIRLGKLEIAKPLLLWINDGLMALFFFLVGLELKRELLEGHLSSASRVALPAIAAVGGMAVPALIYAFFNWGNPVAMKGWAIPAATDIAFALGVLALLGNRVPSSLKVFLLSLAIFDDVGAIIIIALFYTADLSLEALILSAVLISVLATLNLTGVRRAGGYFVAGSLLWVSVLKSGVHATLAGVILALFIPLRDRGNGARSLLKELEHGLHPWIAFGVLPIFAFANAGVDLSGLSIGSFLQPVPLGIAAGLLVGKQLGIFVLSWIAVKLRVSPIPDAARWVHVYGISLICGIGFTMSLFVASLAFEQGGPDYAVGVRLGILSGSFVAGAFGFLVLWWTLPRPGRG